MVAESAQSAAGEGHSDPGRQPESAEPDVESGGPPNSGVAEPAEEEPSASGEGASPDAPAGDTGASSAEDAASQGASNGATPYELSGVNVPFAFRWPAAPWTTRTITVANNAQLTAALAVPQARIEISAGSYGTLARSENDQHIVWRIAALVLVV